MNLDKAGVIAICRKIYGEDLHFLAQTLFEGGIRFIEVPFDQQESNSLKNTSEAISSLRKSFPEMHIGAGTVINLQQLNTSYNAGAEFIISPNIDTTIIKRTREMGMLSMPGAMTPSEILTAWDAGANYVKIFPAANLGVSYIKAVRSPISHIPMMAVGGISVDNFADFLKAGCCGAGIGGSLCSKQMIEERNADALRTTAQKLVDIFKQEKGL